MAGIGNEAPLALQGLTYPSEHGVESLTELANLVSGRRQWGTRLDNGRLPLRPTTVEVAPVFALVRDYYADAAAEAGRFIMLDVPQPVSVQADPDRVRQLLSNLVDNAIRHRGG